MQSWKRILPSLPNHTERYPSAEEHSPVVLTSATPNSRSVSAHANFVECNALKPKYKDTARSAYTWRSILRGSRKFESQITTHIDAVFPRSISQMEPNYTQSHSSRGQVASESDCFGHHHPSHTHFRRRYHRASRNLRHTMCSHDSRFLQATKKNLYDSF